MALTKIDDRGLKTPIDLQDNEKIRLGTGNDLEIYHDSSHSYIKDAGTGTLRIEASEVGILSADGSETMAQFVENGAASLRYNNSTKFETKSDGVLVTGELQATTLDINGNAHIDGTLQLTDDLFLADNDEINVGSSNDLKIYHNGSHSYISSATGNFNIGANTAINLLGGTDFAEYMARFIDDGAVELYNNGDKKLETTSSGCQVTGILWADGIDTGDNEALMIGDGDDLQLYHDGTKNLIETHNGEIHINKGTSEYLAKFIPDGAVELYYDNTKRFQTLSDGAEVKGVLHVLSEDGNVHTHKESYYLSIATSTTKTITLTGLNGTAKFTCGGYANAGQGAIALQIIFGGGMYATQHYDVQVLQNNAMQNTSISLTKNGTSYVIAIENSSSSWALNLSMSVESTGAEMGLAIS